MTAASVTTSWFDRGTSFLRELYAEFQDSNVSFMAGSIAYSAFVSLFPLLVLAVIVATFVGGAAFAEQLVALTERYLSPSGQELIIDSLTRATGRAELSVLTLVVFLWATLRVFRGLDVAFSILYDTAGEKGILDQLLDGLIVLFALGVAIAGSVVLYMAMTTLPAVPFLGVVEPILLAVFLIVSFLPMYYVFPDTSLTVRQILPGAVVAGLGWTGLQLGFRVYVALSSKSDLYGVIGAVILIITWLYFGALIVLLGATVNVVLDRRKSPGVA
jgi:membrane protein